MKFNPCTLVQLDRATEWLASDRELVTGRHTIVEVRRNLARLLTGTVLMAARAGFLEDLASDGYGGTISLEVDLRRYLTDDARLRAVMIEMRERCEKRLVAGAPEL